MSVDTMQGQERKMPQEEILAKLKLVAQSLSSLKTDHAQTLNQLTSGTKEVDPKNQKIIQEKEEVLRKIIRNLELGVEESQVGWAQTVPR